MVSSLFFEERDDTVPAARRRASAQIAITIRRPIGRGNGERNAPALGACCKGDRFSRTGGPARMSAQQMDLTGTMENSQTVSQVRRSAGAQQDLTRWAVRL